MSRVRLSPCDRTGMVRWGLLIVSFFAYLAATAGPAAAATERATFSYTNGVTPGCTTPPCRFGPTIAIAPDNGAAESAEIRFGSDVTANSSSNNILRSEVAFGGPDAATFSDLDAPSKRRFHYAVNYKQGVGDSIVIVDAKFTDPDGTVRKETAAIPAGECVEFRSSPDGAPLRAVSCGGSGFVTADITPCVDARESWEAQRKVAKSADEVTAKARRKESAARKAWKEARADVQKARGASASKLAKLRKILAEAEKLKNVTAKKTKAAAKRSKAAAKQVRKLFDAIEPACT